MSDSPRHARPGGRVSLPVVGNGRRQLEALAVLALLAATAPFAVRLARNTPGLLPVPAGSFETALLLATLGPALATVGLAVGVADPVERVALIALAVFAPLALVADAAYLAAASGVTVAGGVVAGRRLAPRTDSQPRSWVGRRLLAGAGVAAVAASLAATTGLAPVAVRHAGSVLALVAATSAGLATDTSRVDWAAGAVAASLVYAAGTTAPYVTGAVALVAGGVVGASLPLLAVGVGGVTAGAFTSLRRGAFAPAAGALLLLVAGVPVTVPRALAVTLGIAFLLGGDRA